MFEVRGRRGKSVLRNFGIALTIGRRVEDGIHVVEDIFRAKGLLQITSAIGDKGYAEFG